MLASSLSVCNFACVVFVSSGTGLLRWCTVRACVGYVLSCVCFVSVYVFVLLYVGFLGLGIFDRDRQGSIPWRSWRTGCLCRCSLPLVDPLALDWHCIRALDETVGRQALHFS